MENSLCFNFFSFSDYFGTVYEPCEYIRTYLVRITSIKTFMLFIFFLRFMFGSGSSVSIATRYGLDGPGIESRCRRDFLHVSRPALGPTQPPVQWVLGVSRG